MNRRSHMITAWILAFLLCFSSSGSTLGQQNNQNAPAQDTEAPAEVTILKHRFGSEGRFINETRPSSQTGATQVVQTSVLTASVKLRSNTTKTIVGISWYFILQKSVNEEYFRIHFVSRIEIQPHRTQTLKEDIKRIPMPPRAVSIDELKNQRQPPGQERIVVNCVLFSDGSFSPLNDSAQKDCQRLTNP